MTFYEQLLQDDWVQYFEEEMDKGTVKINDNNKFYSRQIVSKNNPWIYNKNLSVNKSMKICNPAHNHINPMGFIHSICLKCYKVVVQPNTVKQLFQLYDLQKDMQRPAKCGIEVRNYVPRLYGGYFYNNSLEKGRECYKIVRSLVDKHISPDVNVLLKRGCTEFEMKYGPSDKWHEIPGQEVKEAKFDRLYIEEEGPRIEHPPELIAYKKRTWLHWASDHYDPTVVEFTGGKWLQRGIYYRDFVKPYLFPNNTYVTYHEDLK